MCRFEVSGKSVGAAYVERKARLKADGRVWCLVGVVFDSRFEPE